MIIYKTTNLINGKIYIGQDCHNDPNYYGSGICLNNSLKKYGKENFKKEIICECATKEELDEKEKYWIKELKSKFPNGYNLTDGGGGNLGYKMSEETKNKISKGNKGKVRSDDFKKKVGLFFKGKPKSEEQNRKNSESQIGEKNHMYGKKCPEHSKRMKEKMKGNKYFLGHKHTEETKLKIGEGSKGIKNGFFGKHHSEETKNKIREKNKLGRGLLQDYEKV